MAPGQTGRSVSITELFSDLQWDLITTISHMVIVLLLGIAVFQFNRKFIQPGWRLGKDLAAATDRLRQLKSGTGPVDVERVGAELSKTHALAHAWSEFKDTLHPQYVVSATGERLVGRWRATVTANTFFSEQAVVETQIGSEFFKHLPGILTGLGILGTFSGLIIGLKAFGVSDDATVVRESLSSLLGAVGGAFFVSASAIGLAMLITVIEKTIISRRYAQLETLCGVIDSLFESGAGEEYLARLAEAADRQVTQAQHIKDALVNDLKTILTELTERQMASVQQTNQQLGLAISQTISDSLKRPLEDISGAVKHVASQQGDAVNRMLTDVLSSFAGRMEGMFGGQLSGMNDLLRQTAETMQSTTQRFETLASKIESAGTGAAEKMADRMENLMEAMAERQSQANAQMAAFIDQLKQSVSQGQSDTAELMQATFTELSQTANALTSQLRQQAQGASEAVQRSTEAFVQQAEATLQRQSDQMQALVQQLQEQGRLTAESAQKSTAALAAQTEAALAAQSTQLQEAMAQAQAQSQRVADTAQESARAVMSQTEASLAAQGDQVRALVQQLQQQGQANAEAAQRSATALADHTEAALARQNGQLQALMAQMQEMTQQALESARRSAQTHAQQSEAALAKQADQLRALIEAVGGATQAMRDSTQSMRQGIEENIRRLGLGAESLLGASGKLEGSLQSMTNAAQTMGGNVDELAAAARTLGAVTTAQQDALADHRQVREAVAAMVEELRKVVETASRDASMSVQLVSALENAAGKLTAAKNEAADYLEGITKTMTDIHERFAAAVTSTLHRGNADFQKELGSAVNILRGAIQDLGDTIDAIPSRR